MQNNSPFKKREQSICGVSMEWFIIINNEEGLLLGK